MFEIVGGGIAHEVSVTEQTAEAIETRSRARLRVVLLSYYTVLYCTTLCCRPCEVDSQWNDAARGRV